MKRAAVAVIVALGLGSAIAVPASAGDDPAPCKLLTRSRIAAVLEQPARKGREDSETGSCRWRLRATETRAAGQVDVLVERGKRADADLALVRRLAGVQPVDGLGREAWFDPSSGVVWVRAPGRVLFYVQANVYDAERNRIEEGLLARLVELGETAEARL